MVDEFKLLREAGRSSEAQSLLDNALFNEGLAALERDLIAEWKTAADQVTRESCWHSIRQLGRLKGYFESVLGGGKLAASQLKALADDGKRRFNFR